jgi:hypothetical protein
VYALVAPHFKCLYSNGIQPMKGVTMTVAVFAEGETVQLLEEEGVFGVVEVVHEDTDPDTDRVTGETVYDVVWTDGEYSSHLESELVGLCE